MSSPDNAIWALDAIAEASAELSHEEGPPTEEELAHAATYMTFVTHRIAALRCEAADRVVRPSIVAMTRPAMLARFDEIRAQHPGLIRGGAHHQHGAGVKDDLRSALEAAERAIESG